MYWHREIDLAPPQIFTLSHLARHRDLQGAFDTARSRLPPLIELRHLTIDGHRAICDLSDAEHPVREIAFPGMSRLVFGDGRFEPVDGLAALLG